MTSKEHNKIVLEKNQLIQSQIPSTSIIENYSSLKSLQNSRLDLMFRPSIIADYQYLVRRGLIGKIGRVHHELQEQCKTLVICLG